MKKIDLRYIAGIFDGEGYVGIVKNKRLRKSKRSGKEIERASYSIHCSVTNSSEWLCRMLQFMFGGSVSPSQRGRERRKDLWVWQVACQTANSFLLAIQPYVVLKKPQVDLAIKFREAISERSNLGFGRSLPLSDNEKAVKEAQFILMQSLKR